MGWSTVGIILFLLGVVCLGIWAIAYRLGFKEGRSTLLPSRLVNELLDHKIICLGQDPAETRVEVGTELGIPEWESKSLGQRVQARGR